MVSQKSAPNGRLASNLFANTEPLWTVEELAQYLRLNAETVRMMAREEKIPAIKVGKVWRFRPKAIKVWLSEQGIILRDGT